MFKKYPFVKQTSLKDCGAACVMMIVKYYHGSISYIRLNEMLKITRKGITAYHIVETLKTLGFKAYGMKSSFLKPTKIPFIANLIISNSYKHYVVVYEVTKSFVLIADPAKGLMKISHDKFYKMWTGVNLLMYPVRPIAKLEDNSYLKILKQLLTPNLKKILVVGLLSFLLTLCGIIGSFFFQSLIDNLNNPNNLKLVVLIFALLSLIKIGTSFVRNHLLIKLTNIIDQDLTKNTFKQIILLPYLYYHNHTTGEIVNKTADLQMIRDVISKVLLTLFIDVPLMVFSGILLLVINKTLFTLTILLVVSYLIIFIAFKKRLSTAVNNTLEAKSEIYGDLTEAIEGFETIKGLSIENTFHQNLSTKYDTLLSQKYHLDQTVNYQLLCKDIISNIGLIIILVAGIYLIKLKIITLGLFITYTILLNLFLEPVRNIIDLDLDMKEMKNIIRRVFDLYEVGTMQTKDNIDNIELQNVNFTFDDQKYVLKNINLKISKGEKILVSGQSGSGKSTLFKLIKGYYPLYEGKILINGKPLKGLYSKIHYLPQKPKIFTATIDKNLTLKGSKNLERIKRICRLGDIIKEHDLGYYTLLEEDGFNISGGQKQRIALARALQGYSVLIIDEGLNALDINMERQIIKNLFKNYPNKTIIVISHRLDNLDLFERFIKLDKGKIILDEKRNTKGEFYE